MQKLGKIKVDDDIHSFAQFNEYYENAKTRMIEAKTLKLAKKYVKDKDLVNYCDKTKNSFDDDTPNRHRDLQKQVQKKTGYFNKDYYDANCAVIHYTEKNEYKKLESFKEKKKKELNKQYG